MIDKEVLRKEPEKIRKAIALRGGDKTVVDKLLELDEEWREDKGEADELRSERNKLGPRIAEAKKKGEDAEKLIGEGEKIAKKLEKIGEKEKEFEEKRLELMLTIPNLPHETVPEGKDENDNVEIRKWGEAEKKSRGVEPHYELGARLGVIDFERGVKLGGHRFTVMKGWAAKLERALAQYMLKMAESAGYVEFGLPYLVREECLFGTGQLPKFGGDLYRTEEEEEQDELWLIPTAEVPLVNVHREEVLEEEKLPLKYCAFTQCFRREAGEYGRDIKGLMRQHQFGKVELVKFAAPEESYKELESLTFDAEKVLQGLELPYRVVELCTGDLGFGATKTYDLEVWIPSQEKYREISSCSNCEAFQARRAGIKFRREGKNKFVHTLNGSGVAIGRAFISLVENHQEEDGIRVPKGLQDYMETDWIGF
ncbi:serine--tRNA ligase [Candidatus Micrarchaeota archaeon]|nr:serine--tRNA ligase [Candidatus Micrarchaeota archaeon]MBD3418031.1 serine--tRNA ligase [Candidatus Micrarchaeota archaeon]